MSPPWKSTLTPISAPGTPYNFAFFIISEKWNNIVYSLLSLASIIIFQDAVYILAFFHTVDKWETIFKITQPFGHCHVLQLHGPDCHPPQRRGFYRNTFILLNALKHMIHTVHWSYDTNKLFVIHLTYEWNKSSLSILELRTFISYHAFSRLRNHAYPKGLAIIA